MRSVATDARKGLEPEYECTSLAGPHCRTHGPTGDLLSDELSASSAEDGSLLIQLDDTTLGKDGKIDLAKVIEMFGGAMAKKARDAAAATNEAGAAAGAAEGGDDAEAAVREAHEIAAKIGIGRANGVFEMHSPLAAGRRLRPDAVVGRGGEGMASTPSRDDRKVEFINAREATSALYWLDFDGNEVHYVDLPPGMTTMMSTFGSHVWVSRDMATNAAVAAYAVTARKPGEPPVQHFIVTDVDFSDAMAAAAALMAQDTAKAKAGETAANDGDANSRDANSRDANDANNNRDATTETDDATAKERRRSGDRARIDAEIERRRRRHEAARAAAAMKREKLLEEDPLDLRGAAHRLERAKSDARALSKQVREAKEEARRRREEREARDRDGEEREARDRDDSEL